MGFKRLKTIGVGTYAVKITNAEVKNCKNKKQILKLTVKTSKGVYSIFNIFVSNVYLIEKLMKITFEDYNENYIEDEEVDEQNFIGIKMKIYTEEKNGYINIVDITELDSRN